MRRTRRYCFGPITGPIPTCTYPAGGCPVTLQLFTAALAIAFTAFTEALLWSCGTTTLVQAKPVPPP